MMEFRDIKLVEHPLSNVVTKSSIDNRILPSISNGYITLKL